MIVKNYLGLNFGARGYQRALYHFKLMVSKNKIPILAKIVDLGSYLKVFTGIKKKKLKKKFFYVGENLSFGHFSKKKFFCHSNFTNDLTFDHVLEMPGDQFFDIWYYS